MTSSPSKRYSAKKMNIINKACPFFQQYFENMSENFRRNNTQFHRHTRYFLVDFTDYLKQLETIKGVADRYSKCAAPE